MIYVYIYIIGVLLSILVSVLIIYDDYKNGKDFDIECLFTVLLMCSLSFIGSFIIFTIFISMSKSRVLIKGKGK